MKYRQFGDLDWETSVLGFGAMRFPTTEEDDIDREQAVEMIRYAVDEGVNYIDTAWPYHGGESEEVVGEALKDGYRDQVKIATKFPSWELEEKEDLDKYLTKQLEKLEVETIDFYLLHALTEEHWENYKQVGLDYVFNWLEEKQEEGKITNIGFSFHDRYELFEEIVDSYDWDFCQIQYNYVDTEFQAGKKGLKYADEKDIPVIVMEPLKGGILAGDLPAAMEEALEQVPAERTAADWALQWLWNQPEVTLVLSGMSNLQQVKENIASADRAVVNSLSKEELAAVEEAAAKYMELSPVNCTGCGYCMPCPHGVAIPVMFSLYNEASIFDIKEEKLGEYTGNFEAGERAGACVACGECETHCPQNLPIIDLLEEVDEYFAVESSA
jgi:predicted aldo/keto reductase-like oxidoreductase